MQTVREYFEELYPDWRNNYITLAKFAERHGITEEHAKAVLALAKAVLETKHPEA